MKNILPLILLLTGLCSGIITKAQTKEDSLAIEKACRNYVEGWATGDMDRVAKGVSPELVKRTVSQDKEGVSFTINMSTSLLLIATKGNKEGVKGKDLEPDKPFKLNVYICDITGDYALVKTVNTKYGFFDYCQLAKFNGEWKIFNVLWGWLPKEKERP
jgi:hypothetical protein